MKVTKTKGWEGQLVLHLARVDPSAFEIYVLERLATPDRRVLLKMARAELGEAVVRAAKQRASLEP